MSLMNQIALLINRLGEGLVEPTAYYTAWIARIPHLNDHSKPCFPEALHYLRNNQLADGSWIVIPLVTRGSPSPAL